MIGDKPVSERASAFLVHCVFRHFLFHRYKFSISQHIGRPSLSCQDTISNCLMLEFLAMKFIIADPVSIFLQSFWVICPPTSKTYFSIKFYRTYSQYSLCLLIHWIFPNRNEIRMRPPDFIFFSNSNICFELVMTHATFYLTSNCQSWRRHQRYYRMFTCMLCCMFI